MPQHSDTIASRWSRLALAQAARAKPQITDADRVRAYADDPVGFARDVLGIWCWSKQAEIMRAAVVHKRIAIASGHKVSKSTTCAILALWAYCSFPGARIVLMAATDRQVNGIIWREVRRLVRQAILPVPGGQAIGEMARTGLTHPDTMAEIRGYTARDAEGAAGVSAPTMLYFVDEASGVADRIFDAIEGNRAGGDAWMFLISNPTRADGEFYEAFHSKAWSASNPEGYRGFTVDSRTSPNCSGEWRTMQEWRESAPRAGDHAWRPRTGPIKGMAMPDWIADRIREHGEDSAWVGVRIAGRFIVAEAAKIFPYSLLCEAQERWEDMPEPQARLYIGVDPAGEGDGGDQSGFAARKATKVLEVRARNHLSPEGHIAVVLDLIATYASAGQPIVVIDSEGETGARVHAAFVAYASQHETFRVVRMRTSIKAIRKPEIYALMADEIYAIARDWMRQGGAIPAEANLEKDLHAPEFKSDMKGRLKITPKKERRVMLGRSPDLGDAFTLSCWEPLSAREEDATLTAPSAAAEAQALANAQDDDVRGLSPYAGMRTWARH